jgi:hypothetical protein
MDSFLEYVPLISLIIVAGLFVVAIVNFSIVRKNMKMQSEQQIYSRIMEARLKLEKTETFTKMAKESPIFVERFSLVDSPDEYYTIVAFLDLFEFLFAPNKRKMISSDIWFRWKGLAETIMTIPKFKGIWDKTNPIHSVEFRSFMNSLSVIWFRIISWPGWQ